MYLLYFDHYEIYQNILMIIKYNLSFFTEKKDTESLLSTLYIRVYLSYKYDSQFESPRKQFSYTIAPNL